MERIITPEERQRRAEEVYNRRRNNSLSKINYVSENTNKNTEKDNSSSDDKENTNAENKTENEATEKSKEEASKEKAEAKNPVFQMPVEGEIIKKFAKTNLVYSNTLGEWVTHNGIDIKADKTTVVKAAEAGVVKSIKNDPRYGLTIVIEHNDEYQTVYSNLLTSEFVVEGEEVEKGQTIGTVGNTATFEIADESHLHFEILKNNESLDPELYLK